MKNEAISYPYNNMTNSSDTLFYKIFRNIYIRRIITNIQYKHAYELMLTDRSNKFGKNILRMVEENMLNEHVKSYDIDEVIHYSDLVMYKNINTKSYESHLLEYWDNIFDRMHIEGYNTYLLQYWNIIFNGIRDESISRPIFFSYIKKLYNKNYTQMNNIDRRSILTLFLYNYGKLEFVYLLWKGLISEDNAEDKTIENNRKFLQQEYMKLEAFHSETIKTMRTGSGLVPVINIFRSYGSSGIIDVKSIYLIYIRCIYLQMEYIKVPNSNLVLYDVPHHNKYFRAIKSSIPIRHRNIETVKLLYTLSIMKLHNRDEYENVLALPLKPYYYIKNRYLVYMTTSLDDVLDGLIDNDIEHKSIYIDVCNMIKEKRESINMKN